MPVPVSTSSAPTLPTASSVPDAPARDAAHAIEQGQPAPDAWLTPDQLNDKYGTNVAVHTGGDQGVRILDPAVAHALKEGQDPDEELVR